MEFAPSGLKVGDVFEQDGVKLKVTQVFDFGYNTEPVESEAEQIELADLPFSDVEEEAPKKRGGRRKKTED